MAAPSGTKWGSTVGSYGRIGIHVSLSSTNTKTTRTTTVWFWSKYSVSDPSNTFYYNDQSTSATTSKGSVSIKTKVDSGSGWSTSNQVKIYEATYTFNRGTSDSTKNVAAKLSGIDRVGGTMYATTSYTIPKLPSYTVSYNANGGTGAPSSQTKWYGKTLTLSSTKPTRTGYTFLGWSTSSTATSATWAAGGSYTTNASDVLYAVWKANTYTVSYNANGGSGAPSAQTKTYGVALTLSSTKPTRTNYNFKGWGTSASSTTVSYAAGASYTSNSAITLYAVWELAYTAPRITNLTTDRCTSAGTLSEDGTYAKVAFSWATDKTVSSVKIEYKLSTATTWTATTVSATGTSGSVSKVIGGSLGVDNTYDVRVTVTDSTGSSTASSSIAPISYPIDFLAGGKGVAFGKPATKEGFVEFAMSAAFMKGVEFAMDAAFKAGMSVSGTLDVEASVRAPITVTSPELAIKSVHSESGKAITFGVDLSGTNRGVYDDYAKKWMIYANEDYVYVNGMKINPSSVLWSGKWYMDAGKTATLSDSVQNQTNGIVLVWSEYKQGVGMKNSGIHTYFVPKQAVSNLGGLGHNINFAHHNGTWFITKYVYIFDTQIKGNDVCIQMDTAERNSGVKFESKYSVLRYVIGV